MVATRSLQLFFFLFSIFAVVFAIPKPSKTSKSSAPSATPTNICSTGSAQCCNSVQSAEDSEIAAILGLLGIVLGDLGIDVGLACSPIDIFGLEITDCNENALCCVDNSYGNLISIGCIPIIL